MKSTFVSAVVALVCVASAAAHVDFTRRGRLIPPIDPADPGMVTVIAQSDSVGTGLFQQQLDHNDPSKGTFSQKFWWNTEYWGGPGSPVVLFTPGEIAAAGYGAYLTNATLTGLLAQEIKGAVVMVEHRYWGDSSPYKVLNAETLQLLTLEQSIADFVHFAKNAPLPFDKNHTSSAGNAPWVFSGGSYSGALSAWTQSMSPGTFWAYHASSAPVQAVYDYWQYFAPVQQGMPKNCSKDLSLVIDYMDNVWKKGSPAEQLALKTKFGLESLKHPEDVMAAIENGPWLWQSNSFYSNYSGFYQFCDAIENVTAGAAVTPDANGVGLETALEGYAKWTKAEMIPGYCRQFGYKNLLDLGCLDSYDPENLIFTDQSVGNKADMQWQWMLCNEPFGYWQDGAPRGRPSIVSRLVTGDYWQRQCALFFPTTNGFTYGSAISPDINVHRTNKHTQGWRLEDTERLFWVNGEFDPWKTSGMSSEFRPGGPLENTKKHPVQVIPGGFHCSDLRLKNAEHNEGVQKVVDTVVAQIVEWVSEYPNK